MTAIEPLAPATRQAHPVLVTGRRTPQIDSLLTPAALDFLAALSRRFECRRQHILQARIRHQAEFDHGAMLQFPEETEWVRRTEWSVAPIPADLRDRRVEIAGGLDRRTIVTALNSSANVFMADLEDGTAPTWDNVLRGHLNLCDAVDGTIAYEDDAGYHGLRQSRATLTVRPRGWHLIEPNLLVGGTPIAASLFDAGLFAYHNAHALVAQGSGAYFYLPKLESYFEARLWHDVFRVLEDGLGLAHGSIRATALLETVPAAFQVDEILFELRDYITGLRHGRWDYIFSFIKTFRNRPEYVMPERAAMNRRQPFLKASIDIMIHTCHRRGAHAIGGKVAQVPGHTIANSREQRLELVMDEMLAEIEDGLDGIQVIHPAIAGMARGLFDARAPGSKAVPPVPPTPDQLLAIPDGEVTERGLRANVAVTIRYLAPWLGGHGSVSIDGTIENAGTVEIARTQVWQWVHHAVRLPDGRTVTAEMVHRLVREELDTLREQLGDVVLRAERYDTAGQMATALMTGAFCEFMTDVTFAELRGMSPSA